MTFVVRELRKAKADKRAIVLWLHERSPQGASAWLTAYDQMVERLSRNADSLPPAIENPALAMDVREALFRTRRGRIYRALLIIEANEVFILRIRGPGQAPVDAGSMSD